MAKSGVIQALSGQMYPPYKFAPTLVFFNREKLNCINVLLRTQIKYHLLINNCFDIGGIFFL